MKRIARFLSAFASMLLLVAGAAHADVFLVTDVTVDVTAENSVQARTLAFEEARVKAANRLMRRLTMAEDRMRANGLYVNGELASRMAAAVDVQDEKQSGTRYVGLLAVKFDRRAVEAFLKVWDVPYVTSQAATAMIVADEGAGVDGAWWAGLWSGKRDSTGLAPYVGASGEYPYEVTWDDVATEAVALGAERVVVARANLSNENYFVSLYDVRSGMSGRSTIGTAGPFATLEEAQKGAVTYLENVWKGQTIVRATGESVVAAVANFSSQRDWVKIEKALKGSRLVKSMTVEALSTRGADLYFTYAGRPDQLATELRASGVTLSPEASGWMLQAAGYR